MNIGEIIQNRYHIEAKIGQGSMGTTYKALDQATQTYVAIKQLHFSRLQEWKTFEMFEREAKILQQLNHPQIPAYIDYFSRETSTDIRFTLIQQYIEGKTIHQLIESGWRGTEQEILDIFLQLARILTYLHSLQPPVIHRDINPHNIIVNHDNIVHLVDFGAVQEIIRTTFLGGSTIVGTFGYIPFEQFIGCTVPASDYYAAGATLLYMLTHRHPSEFPVEQMRINMSDSVHMAFKTRTLLEHLLEPSPEQRIMSYEQIEAILKERPDRKKFSIPPSKLNTRKKEENHVCFELRETRSQEMRIVFGFSAAVLLTFAVFIGTFTLTVYDLSFQVGLPNALKILLDYDHSIYIPDPDTVISNFITQITLPLSCVLLVSFGMRLLIKGIFRTYTSMIIDLTHKRVLIADKGFGGFVRRVPTASILSVDLPSQDSQNEHTESKMAIRTQAKTIKVRVSQLTGKERRWLVQEINAFIQKNRLSSSRQ